MSPTLGGTSYAAVLQQYQQEDAEHMARMGKMMSEYKQLAERWKRREVALLERIGDEEHKSEDRVQTHVDSRGSSPYIGSMAVPGASVAPLSGGKHDEHVGRLRKLSGASATGIGAATPAFAHGHANTPIGLSLPP